MGQSVSTEAEAVSAAAPLARKQKSNPVVTAINVYPIKSCAEIGVDSASVTSFGFEGDRRFQVVTRLNGDGEWVYCTPRNKACERLFHVKTSLGEDGKLRLSSKHAKGKFVLDIANVETKLKCSVMGDEEHEVLDYGDDVARWLQKATMIANCRLVGMGSEFKRTMQVNADQGEALPSLDLPVSFADEAPFLLCSEESLADLNQRLTAEEKKPVDMRRFRPNIVISGLRPYEEDTPKRIKIGNVEFFVWQRCGRCIMTTIDRDSLNRRGGEPLKTLSTYRERANGQRNFGVHLIPISVSGTSSIKVGDKVEVLEFDRDRQIEWKQKHLAWK
ncbi:hypothetical protein THAOC_13884 [Thalassiosira oceanica]|uniref:MOSC domain-containing protein n=1 Tax=Thalassiosira oceanica TaxID=159749 RepID=K0SGK8_THAOC|nr:hypothetical protein THAOC_13884 [Thalassiosira oceanica]|eukprot:EJK65273.1 hypothetical protein THAOC_13884 [Thalassiosira oceanica]